MNAQNTEIENYLKKGKKIHALEALKRFGCFRLSARIHDLRSKGLNIKTERKMSKGGKNFAVYSLVNDPKSN